MVRLLSQSTRRGRSGAPGPAVLVHNILAPYRIGLFNALHEAFDGEIVLALGRLTHPKRRSWEVSAEDLTIETEHLRTFALDWRAGAIDISLGLPRLLSRLDASAVIVTGYDLFANWRAAQWATKHDRPLIAWTETWANSVQRRGRVTGAVRHRYLSRCDAFVVPGQRAEKFVRQFVPDGPVFHAPNSVDVPELRTLPRPPAPGRALFLGETEPHKGFDILTSAIPGLLEIFDGVDIAGKGTMLEEAKHSFRDEPGVVFHGSVDAAERARIMANCSTLILPSRRDSWPLVAVEALVAQRSLVLGPGVGSAPDLKQLAGDGVAEMERADRGELIRAASAVVDVVPPLGVRDELTHEASAVAFRNAVRRAADELQSSP